MTFTIESAKQVLDDYYDLVHPQYEDDIQFINALEFLIQETNNPEYMVELGGWYYGQKDYPKYVQIIKSLYPLLQGATNTFDPVPEIYSRLAKIYVEEGNEDQAIQLLLIAKEFQSQRLIYSDFFGDLTIIKHIVLDLYSLIQFDSDYMDLFDLYYVLQKPCKLALEINGEDYIIEAKYEDDLFYISMDDKNYEDVDQFFQNAMIHDEPLYSQYVNVNYLEMLD